MSTAKQVAQAKAKLAPILDEPFFTEQRSLGCDHSLAQIKLDERTRTATCTCGVSLDPFECLLIYSRVERRLVNTWHNIQQARDKQRAEQARAQARRPHYRRVTGRTAVLIGVEGEQEIIGYDCALECGHTQRWEGVRRVKHLTCRACVTAAKLMAKVQP